MELAVAIGGAADMEGHAARPGTGANDPQRSLAGPKSRTAASPPDLIADNPFQPSLNGHAIDGQDKRDQLPLYVVSDKNNHASSSGCELVVVL
jgi:hypothetical protein